MLGLAACRFPTGSAARDGAIDAEPDAAEVDAVDAAFNPATDCPVSYADTLASSSSRYQIVQTLGTGWPQLALCNTDLPGRTHAATLETLQEVVELDALLDARLTIDRFYVGGVQSPTATAMNAGWIGFDGKPLLMSAWYTPENEPDDGADGIENQTAQLLIIDHQLPYFHDAAGISVYGVVCECDGVPVHPTAQTYVDTDPNNPN